MKDLIFVVLGWSFIGLCALILSKYKKRVAKKMKGSYASVEAARAVLQFSGYRCGYMENTQSKEIWSDKNFRNSLLVVKEPDGRATIKEEWE